MMYLEGGDFSGNTFVKSLDNLMQQLAYRMGSRAFAQAGGWMVASACWSYWTTTTIIGAKVAGMVATAASLVSGPLGIVLGIAAGLGAAGLVYWMGTSVRFD
ncbi:MAG: hypothetical protein GX660_16270 [Clostridiaceae bacterium]|nr:hypothetical protein [Clostridiaceae bacterium]